MGNGLTGPILGVTGGIGSGKTVVSDLLHNEFGIHVVDADVVAREVVAPEQPAFDAIVSRFPESLSPDGTLNRLWLRTHVLPDDERRKWLESITHPAIRQSIVAQLASASGPYRVLVSPLLFESGQAELCDATLVVDAAERQQVERAMQRDGNGAALIQQIMSKQWPRDKRLQAADFIIDNTGSLEALHKATQRFHHRYVQQLSSSAQ
ncbi:dephospho-CoA kinase [Salinispirillum sp. LH 10-3-1]|uniref:Dephospho-CoA kinase n=1 Tax=Salinispirillum sp. LH 10-3-1 TaxID=2952525 RepID=A0AB38YI18_9GAMM